MTNAAPVAAPNWMRWLGFILSGLGILFMLMDATMKILQLPIVLETTLQIGWPVATVVPLGIVLLLCTALYAAPRTSVLGAVLLTAYLGGAVATHARIGSPLFATPTPRNTLAALPRRWTCSRSSSPILAAGSGISRSSSASRCSNDEWQRATNL